MSTTGLSLRRRTSFVLAVTFGLITLADFLFYKQPVGWNTALFGAALIAAVLLRDGAAMRTWVGRFMAAACGGLLVALAIEPGPLPIIMGLLALVSLAILDRNGLSAAAALWLGGWARFACRAAAQPFRDARTGQRRQRARGVRFPMLITTVRWIIPIILSLVFVGLFALANPIIADWTADLPEIFAPLRLMMWLVVGLAAWALLRTRLRRRHTVPLLITKPSRYATLERDTGSNWIVRCLVLFNVVFAVQTVLDAMYLVGGATLPKGMTYAEYAHRGAYPLIATALLAALFVLLTFRPGGLAQRSVWARRLVFLWVAQNVMLVAASMWRLSLYVDVYSLTRWRVAAGVWMALVAIGLVLLIVRIAGGLSNRWLVQANTAGAALVLYACCFVGFDRLIADYNVRHCREIVAQQPDMAGRPLLNAPLDMAYLEQLGPDAIPALRWYATRINPEAHPGHRHEALSRASRMRDHLDTQLSDWRGWTLRRLNLAQVGLARR